MIASVADTTLLRALEVLVVIVIWLFFFRVIRSVWAETRYRNDDGENYALATNRRAEYPVSLHAPVQAPLVPQGALSAVPGAAVGGKAAQGSRSADGYGVSAGNEIGGNAAQDVIATLKVVEPKESRGRIHRIGENFTIGRAQHCNIKTDDSYTSNIHARFYRNSGALWVEDMHSTNGTWVNAQRVSGPARLKDGDLVQIGGTVFEVSGCNAK